MAKMVVTFNDPGACEECGGRIIYDGNGLLVCSQCGLVYGIVYDMPLFEKRRNNGGGWDQPVHYGSRKLLTARSWPERFLMETCLRKLKLPVYVAATALKIIRKAEEEKRIVGGAVRYWAAAAIYVACRAHGYHLSFPELKEAVWGRKHRRIEGIFNYIVEASKHVPEFKPESPRKAALKYVEQLCSKLCLKPETRQIAYHIVSKFKEHFNPRSLAAAATYTAALIAEERRVTQQEVAKAAEITEVTLRTWFYKIVKQLTIEVYL